MSTTNTCQKCGCQDIALTSAPVYPAALPCPNPEPCSEGFNSKCVYYTGDDIMCGNDIVVHQDETVDTALNDIVDYFCASIPAPTTGVLPVSITKNGSNPQILNSVITGGTAPFTYNWTYAQNLFPGHNFTGSTTSSSVTFIVSSNGLVTTIVDTDFYQTLVKLEITDANGNYGSAYWLHTTTVTGRPI